MQLTDSELRDLAVFLARRVTPELGRPDPSDAPQPGRTPPEAWLDVLREAREAGRLPQVIGRAAQVVPEDRALQEASTLVEGRPGAESLVAGGMMVLAAAALLLISVAGLSTVGVLAALEAAAPDLATNFSADRAQHPEEPQGPSRTPSTAVASVAALWAPTDAATGAGDVGPAALAPVDAPGTPAPGAASRAPRGGDGPSEEPLEQVAGDDPCAAAGPGRIGWFYVGRAAPGPRVVLPYATHVRAERPSRDNGWSRNTAVRCVLGKGDVVRLSGEAVELPGGHWWAPLSAGDAERVGDEVALAD